MDLKQLFDDEDAVSPVIGVILMVAITVILAAVIGTFVLGLGDQVQSSAPNANFQFNYSDGSTAGFQDGSDATESLGVTHNGGQDISKSTLTVQVGGTAVDGTNTDPWGANDAVSTGDIFVYNESGLTLSNDGNTDLVSGDTVRVVWEAPNGGSSNTIGSSTVPN